VPWILSQCRDPATRFLASRAPSSDSRAARIDERALQSRCEVAPLIVGEELAEQELAAVCGEPQLRPPVRPFAEQHARPEWVEIEALPTSARVHPRHSQLLARNVDQLEKPAGAVVELEGEIDEKDIEAEEACYGPGSHHKKLHAENEADDDHGC